MNLLLKNMRWCSQDREEYGDLRIGSGKIVEIGSSLKPKRNEKTLELNTYYLYPGLINGHDHLEMNLYPKLGNPPYTNYVQWAKDIYHPPNTPLREIQKVPLADRLLWSACKNLVSGAVTVVHHNPYYPRFFRKKYPIRVLKNYNWAHSVEFEKNIFKAYKKYSKKPFIIHAAEGIDEQSFQEINILEKSGVLGHHTVLVHGIALTDDQINKLSDRGASIVWCPTSNFYLFNQTAAIDKLKKKVRIALGTDSTLTGSPTLFDEMRTAYSTGLVSFKEIYQMVTTHAASMFEINDLSFNMEKGESANLFILPRKYDNYYENLVFAVPSDIALVMIQGTPKYADTSIAEYIGLGNANVLIDYLPKWICCDIKKLRERIEKVVGEIILTRNPLWNRIREIHTPIFK